MKQLKIQFCAFIPYPVSFCFDSASQMFRGPQGCRSSLFLGPQWSWSDEPLRIHMIEEDIRTGTSVLCQVWPFLQRNHCLASQCNIFVASVTGDPRNVSRTLIWSPSVAGRVGVITFSIVHLNYSQEANVNISFQGKPVRGGIGTGLI